MTTFSVGASVDEADQLPLLGLGEEFQTDTVFDAAITLELYAVSGGYGVEIRTIEHGYPWAQIRTVRSPETPCTLTPPFLDFECETNATRIANSSAFCGLASGGVFCSGTLISNQSHVLTANHCVSTQSGANTTNLWFRDQELCGTGTLRETHVVPAPQTFVIGQPSGPGADFTVLRANGTPINTTLGLPTIPNPNFGYRMVSGPANRTAALWMGLGSLNLDLSGAGASGCFLLNTLDIASFTSATNASGEAFVASPVPSDPLLDGLTVFVQWVAIDPGAPRSLPVVLSNGLRITLCL